MRKITAQPTKIDATAITLALLLMPATLARAPSSEQVAAFDRNARPRSIGSPVTAELAKRIAIRGIEAQPLLLRAAA